MQAVGDREVGRDWPRWDYDNGIWVEDRACEACRVLGEFGPRARDALGALEELALFPGAIGKSAREARAKILGAGAPAESGR